MKWYIEFPIVYVVVVVILYFLGRNTWEEASLFVSLILGLFFAIAGYTVYKKEQKMKSASEDEKAKMKEKERKSNRFLIWVIIALIIFCIVLFGVAMFILGDL